MLQFSAVFLIVACIAAILGFGALTGMAAYIARTLFALFCVIAMISLLAHGWSKRQQAGLRQFQDRDVTGR